MDKEHKEHKIPSPLDSLDPLNSLDPLDSLDSQESTENKNIKKVYEKVKAKKEAKDLRLKENKEIIDGWEKAKITESDVNSIRNLAKGGDFDKINQMDFLRDKEYLLKIAAKYRHLDKIDHKLYDTEDLDDNELTAEELNNLQELGSYNNNPIEKFEIFDYHDSNLDEDFDQIENDYQEELELQEFRAFEASLFGISARDKAKIQNITDEEKEFAVFTAFEIAAKYKNLDQIPQDYITKEIINKQKDCDKLSLLEIAATNGSLNQIPKEKIDFDDFDDFDDFKVPNFVILAIQNGNFKQIPKKLRTIDLLKSKDYLALKEANDYAKAKKNPKSLKQLEDITGCFNKKSWDMIPKELKKSIKYLLNKEKTKILS